jgi:uncharacterized protein YcnI
MKLSTARTRTGLAAALATGIALAVAGPAAAHVSVQAPGAAQKSFAALNFRVPTERDDASTTKVEINFPAKQPLAYVSVKPHPGWTYQVTKSPLAEPMVDDDGNKTTEAVSKITWTASSADTGIKPGEYDEFSVSAGFLPEAAEMVFTAIQTYSDGEVVKWIEPSTGAAEPEHPAPVLKLAAASADGDHHATADQASATGADSDHDEDGSAVGTWLGGIALVVALAAAGLGGLALRRRPAVA